MNEENNVELKKETNQDDVIQSSNDSSHANATDEKNNNQGVKLKLLTKSEGLLMFGVICLVTIISMASVHKYSCERDADITTRMEQIQHENTVLMDAVSDLEEKIDSIIDANAHNKPINITINADGEQKGYIVSPDGDIVINPENNESEQTPSGQDVFDEAPFLGVAFYEGNDGSQNPIGLQIDFVYQFSPAEFAGLKAGDIIMMANGMKVNTIDDLTAAINMLQAGDTLSMQICTISDSGINIINVDAPLTYRGNFALDETNNETNP